jgi:hypothetical protein
MTNGASGCLSSLGSVAATNVQIVNAAIVYGIASGGTPYAGGDGTMKIVVLYVIEDVS